MYLTGGISPRNFSGRFYLYCFYKNEKQIIDENITISYKNNYENIPIILNTKSNDIILNINPNEFKFLLELKYDTLENIENMIYKRFNDSLKNIIIYSLIAAFNIQKAIFSYKDNGYPKNTHFFLIKYNYDNKIILNSNEFTIGYTIINRELIGTFNTKENNLLLNDSDYITTKYMPDIKIPNIYHPNNCQLTFNL